MCRMDGCIIRNRSMALRGSREADKVIAQIYDFPNTRIRKEAVWASNLLIPAVQLAAGGIIASAVISTSLCSPFLLPSPSSIRSFLP